MELQLRLTLHLKLTFETFKFWFLFNLLVSFQMLIENSFSGCLKVALWTRKRQFLLSLLVGFQMNFKGSFFCCNKITFRTI